jgi:hypothetical protein
MKWIVLLASFCLGIGGCAQDSIFYNISYEVIPKDPTIPGSPTKIVQIEDKLFVASGRIYGYTKSPAGWSWERMAANPDSYVSDISSARGILYALAINNNKTSVWKRSDGENWDPTPIPNNTEYTFIQSIFGTKDRIFAGAGRKVTTITNRVFVYAILYEGDDGEFHVLKEETVIDESIRNSIGELSGAGKIGSTYYLGTKEGGILSVGSSLSPDSVIKETIDANSKGVITGLIQVAEKPSGEPMEYDLVIAVSKDGYVFVRSSKSDTFASKKLGGTFSGSLALADATYLTSGNGETLSPAIMLLIGIRGGNSYTYGYRETLFDIDSGVLRWDTYQAPGNSAPSSIKNKPKYDSSLGRFPITSIVAFTEPVEPGKEKNQILFASTQSNGLYSYRNEEWNAEQ